MSRIPFRHTHVSAVQLRGPGAAWADPSPPTPSPRSARISAVLTQTVRRTADRLGTSAPEAWFARRLFDTIGSGAKAHGTTSTTEVLGGVLTHRVTTPAATSSRSIVLYVHGGGFVFGSYRSHGALASWLSHHSRMPVLFPEYRRAPEHHHPAARDDVITVYRRILELGIPAENIAIAGDSAGCYLILETLAELARTQTPTPGAAALLSPWLDLSCDSMLAADSVERDPMASPHYGRRAATAYLGESALERPQAHTRDLSAWPPTLMQVGGTECMLPAAQQFAQQLSSSGVSTDFQVWPGQVHVFHAMSGFLPEGRQAIKHVGTFLSSHVDSGGATAAS
ncbi:alpha/beta hydrolase fold domain-containing protein [Nocardia sp. ET3-3]|uniref:Alpha/beta hydrolase fold domain-containing protein n=1 Tax=Nocardia terrae TaxID=2675851 RepID=A0A7K1V2P0_9NOCA|nr:alpha/beta hydrolase [Nocardia terrae]MVU80709.1 alpha/beta hydrolase fold domain-containing protein [Nocardia terrae]